MKARLRDIDVFYLEEGPPRGLPVVLLHAYPMSHGMWEPQLFSLTQEYRVLGYDVRGLGQTGLGDYPFTMETWVDDLLAFLDHLKIDCAVLCGISMGGYIALRAVQRNPERVKALVLTDTQSLADGNEARLHRHEALQVIQGEGLASYAEGFSKKVLCDHTLQANPQLVQWVQSLVTANSTLGVSRAILALVSRMDTTEALSQIKVPTLVIRGAQDKLIPEENSRALQGAIPGSRLVIIPKAGHFCNMENPEAFNEVLTGFLKGLPTLSDQK